MMRRLHAPLDIALGSLLSVAAAGFGVVGFIAGLRDNVHASQWFLGALILGVLSGAVLLDEARTGIRVAARQANAWLGTLLLVVGLGVGTVGFILGLLSRAHASTWLSSGLTLAILALATTMDEVRRLRAVGVTADALSLLSLAFGVLGLALGVVGFVLGLMSRAHADIWLWAAIVSSVIALGWSFEAEHREALVVHQPGGIAPLRP